MSDGELTPAEQEILNQAGRDAAELVRAQMAHDYERSQAVLDNCVPEFVARQLAILAAGILTADEAVLTELASHPSAFFLGWEKTFGEPPAEPQ